MKKITILFACIYFCSCNSNKPPLKTGMEGQPMPTFNLLLNDSITYFSTNDIPKGKPAVLFYFSPRCPYCRAEMSEILGKNDLLKEIHFYMITNFPFSEMKTFSKDYKLESYPNITVGNDSLYFFSNYFKAEGVPYMAIYDKDKNLKSAYIGQVNSRTIIESTK